MKVVVALALFLSACAVHGGNTNAFEPDDKALKGSIVSVYAGYSELGATYYLVDKRAQVCWFGTRYNDYQRGGPVGSASLAPLDCCKLRSVPELQADLGFLTGCA